MRTTLSSFANWAKQLVLENGKPFRLQPFQRTVLKEYFSGATETLVVMPKKNGKTTLMGALALYHLVTTKNPEVVIAASSRDQAAILFNQAAGLVQRSGLEDTFDVRPGYREIRLKAGEGYHHKVGNRIRVLAADSATADGVIPTLALVDELHRHRSGELYGVFRDGLGPRKGQLITISTAGSSMESPLGELRSNAYRLANFKREGVYTLAKSADGSFVMHEWCLDPDQDVSDMELVKQANPAPWHTPETLRKRYESPSTTDSQWRRFACGIWTEHDEPWVTAEEWSACDEPLPDLEGLECYGGLDLSATTDSTAFVLAFPVDERVLVLPHVFLPAEGLSRRIEKDRAPYDTWAREGKLTLTPGPVVDYAFVKQTILESAERYKLKMVGYDRWNSSHLVSELVEQGIQMVAIGQGFKDMAQPMQDFRRLIRDRKMVHGDHPVLRRHVASMGVMQDPAGNVKPAKNKSTGRIDAAAATIMALAVLANKSLPTESAYADQLCSCPKREPRPHLWRADCEALQPVG